MEKLTNEEIARVFAIHIGCYCKFTPTHKESESWVEKLTARDLERYGWRTDWYQLILIPLHKISDGHCVTLAKIDNPKNESKGYDWLARKGKVESYNPVSDINIYQQLILWGYAVPLFFGLNHWANGKTALELGVGIEKH